MRKLFFHKINDIPLSRKFLLIYLFCVLIPIITINVFFFRQISENIKIREEENLRKSIERAGAELHSMIDESVAVSHSIIGDEALKQALDTSYESAVDSYESYNSVLRNKLKRYTPVYPNILEIRIYTYNDTIQSGSNYFIIDEAVRKSAWLMQAERQGRPFRVETHMENSGVNPGKRISVISNMDQGAIIPKYKKFLRIDLNVNKIYDILNRETNSLDLQLVDEQNRIVADGAMGARDGGMLQPADPEAWDSEGVIVMELGEADYVKGWKLIATANNDRINGLLDDAMRSILWLAIISTLIPSLLIFVILRSYHYRVKKLSRHMEKVRNEKFDLILLPAEGRDEIGGLIRAFNVMTEKINTLVNDVYKLEIRHKSLEVERVRMEMNMLQSQMNPHFLFNTLNALLVVCTKNGYQDVTEIIKNLSLLLRRLLNRADDLVPLKEELQFTVMYLQIEKFRFGDRFDYIVDIDPLAMDVRVPIMSIQPLVENACKHGLQSIKSGGVIRIGATMSERGLQVTVTDNGIGITPEKLERLERAIRSEREMDGHVGIRNVYRRLELFYHESVQFRMSSEPEGGLSVSYQIPLLRLDKNAD